MLKLFFVEIVRTFHTILFVRQDDDLHLINYQQYVVTARTSKPYKSLGHTLVPPIIHQQVLMMDEMRTQ